MRQLRVLVTGGSGFIGTHLIRRLHAAGAHITSLDIKLPRERLPGVDYVTADVRDSDSLRFSGFDRIYNLAAVHTTPGHPDHEYYDTNVSGALEITRLAKRLEVPAITFISSISTYGPSEEKKSEASVLRPDSAYGKSKLMAEKIHQEWQSASQGRSLVTVRPAVVFGQGEGGNFARMASLLKRGMFVFPGRRDTIKSCIYVDDLIDLLHSAEAEGGPNVLLNGAYPECPTLERIVTTLRDRYFPRAMLIDIPKPCALAVAKSLAALNGVGGIHPDRVTKLLRSTYVYPQWAADRGYLSEGAFSAAIDRWAAASDRTFV
jgi:nucleoside-diphosphate-sugar epimerase